MSEYNFKLQKVLNYKKDIESVKQGVLSELNNKLNIEEEKLTNYINYKEELLVERNEIQKKTDIRSLRLYNYNLEKVAKDIETQKQLIVEINTKLDEAKEDLLEAMKEKKTLETLKEKDYNEFKSEEEKKQEKIIDNIVSFKNIRQK